MEDDRVELVAEDGVSVSMSRGCLTQIGVIDSMFKTHAASLTSIKKIPLGLVKGNILAKIAEYLEQHRQDPFLQPLHPPPPPAQHTASSPATPPNAKDEDEDEDEEDEALAAPQAGQTAGDESYFLEFIRNVHSLWDEKWVKTLDMSMLIEVTRAANYLFIPRLLDLCCQAIADEIKGLDTAALRKKFNIENDFTPEEELRIREEFVWAEES